MESRTRTRQIAASELQTLAASIDEVLEQHRTARAENWWTVAQLRAALEHALDLLLAVATQIGLDEPDARSTTATRDAVESHLRAAADIEAADARSEVFTKVLVDAAQLVVDEAAALRSMVVDIRSRPRR
jgi:hypothetical protein